MTPEAREAEADAAEQRRALKALKEARKAAAEEQAAISEAFATTGKLIAALSAARRVKLEDAGERRVSNGDLFVIEGRLLDALAEVRLIRQAAGYIPNRQFLYEMMVYTLMLIDDLPPGSKIRDLFVADLEALVGSHEGEQTVGVRVKRWSNHAQ